jgi:thioredoxin reductase (NADPH)
MKEYDIIVIGSGPAGLTAAIYAQRGGMKTLVIGGLLLGGQIIETNEVENFPGFEQPISGFELMTRMINQAKRFGAEIINEYATEVELNKYPFEIKTAYNLYTAKSLIVATGASAKWLGIDGEERFKGKGVSSCATCDAFFYKGKTVAVIGGGDTAASDALFLTKFAQKVYLIHRRDKLRAAYILSEKLKSNPKIEIIYDHIPVEIIGDTKLNAIIIKNVKTEETKKLDVDGVFVAIGHTPNSKILAGKVKIDESGYIVVNSNYETSVKGVFACGDVVDPLYKQAIIASGSGAIAALNAIKFIESK